MKILIFSDIHGDEAALVRLMNRDADYYVAAGDLANWGRGLDRLGPLMQVHAERMHVIPGNHESAGEIASFCERFGFADLHSRTMDLDGHTVGALGYSNPTPFRTPGEYSEEELAQRLETLGSPEILICHCPPKNSKLDRAGEGQHFGSEAVREFILARQPAYFFCGHIHESAGVHDQFGETKGWNVGKQGYLLEL